MLNNQRPDDIDAPVKTEEATENAAGQPEENASENQAETSAE